MFMCNAEPVSPVPQLCSWLNEKNAIALDESWRDPINLQAKLLKHQSSEAEILVNHGQVEALTQVSLKICRQERKLENLMQ